MPTITIGNSNTTATVNASNSTINVGNGNDAITVNGNNNTVSVGNGNDTLIVDGIGNKVKIGNGNDFIILDTLIITATPPSASNPISTLTAGNGNDHVNDNSSGNYSSILDLNLFAIGTLLSGNTYAWGPVTMVLGNGNNTVYGDLYNLSLSATNGGLITNNVVNFGSSKITVGNGNSSVYGNLNDLTLTASAFSIIGGFGGVGGGNNTFTFGNNTLTAGNGNDSLYGNMRDLNISAFDSWIGGLNGDFGPTPSFNSFTFGNNTLIAGNGNDFLYGTLRDINFLTVNPTNNGMIGGVFGGGNTLFFGANKLTAGNGNDTIYGTLRDMNWLSIDGGIGGFLGGYDEFTFSSNTIKAGNGNDWVYGTMRNLSLDVHHDESTNGNGGLIGGFLGGHVNLTYLGNTITLGNGNNHVFGTLNDMVSSSVSLHSPFNSTLTGGAIFQDGSNFNFGSNTIVVGNGNNYIYGTMHDQNINVTGALFGGVATFEGLNFNFSSNQIKAGNGNDYIYGSMHDISIVAYDYNDAPGRLIGATVGGSYGGSNKYTFANNTITAGNGNNTLYGTLEDISLVADKFGLIGGYDVMGTQFDFIGGVAGPSFNSFDFGNNILSAGNGNDVMYGSMRDLHLSATNNSAIGNGDGFGLGAVFSNLTGGYNPEGNFNIIYLGNNTLTSGNGNDTLYGSMHNLVLSRDDSSGIQNNIIQFGTNVLNAGTGNVTLVGQVYNIVLPPIDASITDETSANVETISNFLAHNTIAPGMNTFNLHGYNPVTNTSASGSGVDTLVFNLAINIGVNIVNHFYTMTDVLEFRNVNPTHVNEVYDLSILIDSIGSNSQGGTLITFKPVAGDTDSHLTLNNSGIPTALSWGSTNSASIDAEIVQLAGSVPGAPVGAHFANGTIDFTTVAFSGPTITGTSNIDSYLQSHFANIVVI